jgi:hypothetical protein
MQLKSISCPIDFSEFSAAAYQHAMSLAEHSFAQKENMEVIVMGTHGRQGFDHLVQGSTADRIMRKAACPVLVVPNTSRKALGTGPDGRHRLSRILYYADFSNNSERARAWVRDFVGRGV